MKNFGALITVAVMLLAGLAAFLLWGPFGEKPGLRESPPEAVQPAGEAPGAAGQPGAKSGAGRSAAKSGVPASGPIPETSSATSESAAAGAAAPSATPAAAAPAAAPHKPDRKFPLGNDIALGTEKSTLQASFGKPTMRTSSVESGRLLETWVYLQSEPNVATFLLLRNGRVVSANTTVY